MVARHPVEYTHLLGVLPTESRNFNELGPWQRTAMRCNDASPSLRLLFHRDVLIATRRQRFVSRLRARLASFPLV